jgi:hypothetical protein
VENAGRPVTVLLERAEERSAVPLRHPLQDRQVQFQHALAGVENSAEVLAEPPGDVLDLDLGHQIQIKLGAQLRQRHCEDPRAVVGRLVVIELVGDLGVDELGER